MLGFRGGEIEQQYSHINNHITMALTFVCISLLWTRLYLLRRFLGPMQRWTLLSSEDEEKTIEVELVLSEGEHVKENLDASHTPASWGIVWGRTFVDLDFFWKSLLTIWRLVLPARPVWVVA